MLLANKNALTINHPKLLAYLKSIKNTDRFKIVAGPKEQPLLCAQTQTKEKIFLCNPKDPQATASADIAKFGVTLGEHILCIGFGHGHHVRELLYSVGPYGKIDVLLLHPDSLPLLLANVDISDILADQRCNFIWGNIKNIADQFQKVVSQSPRLYYHDISLKVALPELQPLVDIIERLRKERENESTRGLIVLENYRRNLGWIPVSHGVEELSGKFIDKPAIVIAAGPSLDNNVDQLPSFKGRALLLSVDTALRRVRMTGVDPDLVFISDPGRASLNHFDDLDRSLPLAFLPSASWEVIATHIGPKWMAFPHNDRLAEKLNSVSNKGLVWVAGTVTYFALEVARKLGCNPVVFVGLDLALTYGRSHCASARSAPPSEKRFLVPSVTGGTVETTEDLNRFRKAIELRMAQEPQCKFIDATQGGALIKGAQNCTLLEVREKWCKDLFFTSNPFEVKPITEPATVPSDLANAWQSITQTSHLTPTGGHNV